MEKPPVRINNAGVSSISPVDLLRSRAGRAEIFKTIQANLYAKQASTSEGTRSAAGAGG